MGTLRNSIHIQESQSPTPVNGPSPSISNNGFPILAIAVLCITATAFLLISYYILATKCCFRWQQFDPLRRLSFRRQTRNDDPLTAYSPSWQSRGLEELLIREIPTFLYSKNAENGILSKCVVCLNEFQEHDILKLLPKCNHVFHLDCVDVWLQSNANCPLCRSAISGRNRYRLDRIIAPNSSPQDPQPLSIAGSDEDFVVIELSRQQERSGSSRNLVQSTHSRKFDHKIGKPKPRKSHHVSIMGDEGIDVREKDDQFLIQPIRRSFSMDSAVDRHVYLSVQEIMQQNGQLFEVRNNEGQLFEVRNNEESSSSSRGYKSIFSFGHGRGSRNSVLPI